MNIAIIGGWAAGMMAAATILERNSNCAITLFDKNNWLGKKVLISWWWRCNVTTGITDRKTIFSKYTRGSDFLKEAFSVFPPQKVRWWFETQGVPLKNEDDNRVFPVSDDGSDVVGAFEKLFRENSLNLCLGEWVISLRKNTDGFDLETKKGSYRFQIVVLATGWNAYAHTGSTGDGYAFARSCWHTITALGPSLNSFETEEEWCKKLSGLSFQNAQLKTIWIDGVLKSASGPILFTHFGISGPATFALSSHIAFSPIAKETPLHVEVIPDACESFESFEKLLQKRFIENPAKSFRNILGEIMPKRFVDEILEISGIEGEKQAAHVSREERREVAHLLSWRLKITFVSRRAWDEFVTAGGVSLSEVNKKTMESLICPNLYFGGEVLDIDGVTGGFNLQSSWATGRLAGLSILGKLQKSA